MTTHILPFFTRRDEQGREQAVCGDFVTARELAPVDVEPSCIGCGLWFREVEQPTKIIGRITPETPWGIGRTA